MQPNTRQALALLRVQLETNDRAPTITVRPVALEQLLNELERLDLQERILKHVERWTARGQFEMPDLADALDFAVAEVSEAIDARLRLEGSKYVRNRAGVATKMDIAEECFDAIMMLLIALSLLHTNVADIADLKLRRMDLKRQQNGAISNA